MSAQIDARWFSADAAKAAGHVRMDAATIARDSLSAMPKLLAEVALNDQQLPWAALALALSDVLPEAQARFAELWREARDAYIADLVEQKRRDNGLTELEALQRLQQVYA